MASVLQAWVHDLPFMQQTVLLTALRGPDGIKKDHVSKLLLRWLRRCVLLSAFDGEIIRDPYSPGGGSFMGPSLPLGWGTGEDESFDDWPEAMSKVVLEYLHHVDALPHHFQLHFMHAAEIIGYQHPDDRIRIWWCSVYRTLVNDMHLFPEPPAVMRIRLGDDISQWRAHEQAPAKSPGEVLKETPGWNPFKKGRQQ